MFSSVCFIEDEKKVSQGIEVRSTELRDAAGTPLVRLFIGNRSVLVRLNDLADSLQALAVLK